MSGLKIDAKHLVDFFFKTHDPFIPLVWVGKDLNWGKTPAGLTSKMRAPSAQ
jgi:hypothetical protein